MVKSLINSRKKYMKQKTAAFLVMLFVGMLVWTSFGNVASADDAKDIALAQRYAPILYFEQNEKCYPVDVSYALENSNLYQVGNPTPILSYPINASLLANYNSDVYYLDNQIGTVKDDSITADYQSKMGALGYTVYAHVDNTNSVIQYWFFYAFNDGDLNKHEGDWEMVQILLSNGQPAEVMYSQHHSGQRATWNQVEREGDHFKVYVARGSHANYLRSYSGMIGIASDHVGNNGRVLKSAEYNLELLESQAWLNFGGRWGEAGDGTEQAVQSSILGEAGPEGPQFREGSDMWNSPLQWGAALPQANDNIFLLEWLMYNFIMLFAILTTLTLLVTIFLIYRRYKRYGLGPRIVSMLYIDGVNAKSIGNILCIVGLILAVVGLFLPWYAVSVNVTTPSYSKIGLTDLLKIDGLQGVQVTLPESSGPTPMGSFSLPFSLLIAISLVFLILATVGIAQSKKLGRKYIGRGVRLLVPFIAVFVVVMVLASIIPLLAPTGSTGEFELSSTVNAMASAPFGGEKTVLFQDVPNGQVYLKWGFGLGLYLLLFAGIILIVAGVMELVARSTFFEQRQFEKQKKNKKPKIPLPAEELKKE